MTWICRYEDLPDTGLMAWNWWGWMQMGEMSSTWLKTSWQADEWSFWACVQFFPLVCHEELDPGTVRLQMSSDYKREISEDVQKQRESAATGSADYCLSVVRIFLQIPHARLGSSPIIQASTSTKPVCLVRAISSNFPPIWASFPSRVGFYWCQITFYYVVGPPWREEGEGVYNCYSH